MPAYMRFDLIPMLAYFYTWRDITYGKLIYRSLIFRTFSTSQLSWRTLCGKYIWKSEIFSLLITSEYAQFAATQTSTSETSITLY